MIGSISLHVASRLTVLAINPFGLINRLVRRASKRAPGGPESLPLDDDRRASIDGVRQADGPENRF